MSAGSTTATPFSTTFDIPRKWNVTQIPSQAGKLAVITGANGGLGLVTARELAKAGADVVLAVRDTERGVAAAAEIASAAPQATVEVRQLDLADLGSVRTFASQFLLEHDSLDLLINNAGIMATPRRTTADGFESQLGVNHFGHFALTGLLLPALVNAPAARVVTVSSTLHSMGKIAFDDLNSERKYKPYGAYGQSKLANLLFTAELDRRATEAGTRVHAYAAHPGYSSTNLQLSGQKGIMRATMAASNTLFATSPLIGATPTLCAATLPGLPGGVFVGPRSMGGYRGTPAVAKPHKRAQDAAVAARLWDASVTATDVHYDFAASGQRA